MHVDRCRSLHAGDRRWELLSHQLPVPAGRGPGAAGVAQPLSGRAVPSQADRRSVDGCHVERGLLLRHGSRLPCQRVGRVVPRYPAVRGDPLQVMVLVVVHGAVGGSPASGALPALRHPALVTPLAPPGATR